MQLTPDIMNTTVYGLITVNQLIFAGDLISLISTLGAKPAESKSYTCTKVVAKVVAKEIRPTSQK